MAEIWGAAIMVGGALLSGRAAEKKAKEDRKAGRLASKEDARYQGILSQFDREQDYYYQQLEKQEKKRGLDQFKHFNNMRNIDPTYSETNTGPVLPKKPNLDDMLNGTNVHTAVRPPDPATGLVPQGRS